MKIKIRALTSVMHGRIHLHAGDETEVTKGDATDLVDAGLAEIVTQAEEPTAAPTAAPAPTTEDDDMSDMLGDVKMADEPANKMADEPANKGNTRTRKKGE